MAQVSLDPEAFSQLSFEQKALLDTVDNLRSQGVGEIDNLPQIIVVGDQSSGKSSVLEAISRIRFPVKGGICTRFATELVVRTSPREETVVKIQPGKKAVFNERHFTSEGLADLIERAKAAMGIRDDAGGFSEDTLRIEVYGPDLPSLTLVDLPGIYRNETADQSREGMKVVWRLVEKYMKQENSIILAVVNASYDFSDQGILTEVKKHDPNQERTMGVVTNPDRLIPKSIEEGKYVRLVRNQEPLHTLKHGWHVLRNRGPDDNDEQGQRSSRTSDQARDEVEREFFRSGVWESLPSNTKGIDTLRQKLCRVLTKHIQSRLPGVIDDIEEKLEARRESLARLGRRRTTPADLRHYLHDIADNFRNLTRLAVKGTYDDLKFFGDPYADDYPCGLHEESDARKLRAVVRGLNHAFDKMISSKGAKRNIIWKDEDEEDEEAEDEDEQYVNGLKKSPDAEKYNTQSSTLYMDLYSIDDPEDVTWDELKRELEVQASLNQNTNFPGSPNDMLALNHFRDQSRRWRSIAAMHLELVVKSSKTFVELALEHITSGDESTREALLREYVDPFFEQRISLLKERLDELLWHYEHGEAITLETDFIRILSAEEKRRLAEQVNELLTSEHPTLFTDKPKEKLSRRTVEHLVTIALEKRVSQFGLEKVVDMARVYYEVGNEDRGNGPF
jgi:GTPase SAR1 family protein